MPSIDTYFQQVSRSLSAGDGNPGALQLVLCPPRVKFDGVDSSEPLSRYSEAPWLFKAFDVLVSSVAGSKRIVVFSAHSTMSGRA